MMAIASAATNSTQPGFVHFYNLQGEKLGQVGDQ